MKSFTKSIICIIFLFIVLDKCYAEDIEPYIKKNPKEKVRVLFILDTSASMTKKVTNSSEHCRKIISSAMTRTKIHYATCPEARIKVAERSINILMANNPDVEFGLMRMNFGNGGYILSGVGSSHQTISEKISDIPLHNKTPVAETLWEAYRYLTGQSIDYGKNYGIFDNDESVEDGKNYISPFKKHKDECDNNLSIVIISDGAPHHDDEKNATIKSLYKSKFGKNPKRVEESYLPALAEIINQETDLYSDSKKINNTSNIYTIGFGDISDAGKKILKKTAIAGGGQYFAANSSEELVDALENTVISVRADTDSPFAPSLSLIDGQIAHSDSIYYALFSPKKHTKWLGNLKKLKVKNNVIVGKYGNPALKDNGDFLDTTFNFWNDTGKADGKDIRSAGANQQLTTQSSRIIYSEFEQGKLFKYNWKHTKEQIPDVVKREKRFGVPDKEIKDTIRWSKGWDVDDEDNDGITDERRNNIMGDILHSKPVSLNYSSKGVRILVGTNAGFLHMFEDKGDSLVESWAFASSRLFDIHHRHRNRFSNKKHYGLDGPITIYFNDINENGIIETGDKVWAFLGMRRGGRHYYAFDITDPDAPKIMWGGSISKDKRSEYIELGQTWAKPVIGYHKSKGEKPLLFFSAGYDNNQDNEEPGADEMGRGLFVVDAESGKLIWALTPDNGFEGIHSMPGGVTLLDSNYDGFTDRIYAADTNGNIWRVDLDENNIANSSHYKLAALKHNNREFDIKFFTAPKVARTYFSKVTQRSDGSITRERVPYDAVLIGSGDRDKPNSRISRKRALNKLFMIRDINIHRSKSDSLKPKAIVRRDLMRVTSDPFGNTLKNKDKFIETEVQLANFKGWKFDLESGEQAVSQPNIIGGIAYFSSYTAPEEVSACEVNSGKGSLYAFHLLYGAKVYDKLKYETHQMVPDVPIAYFKCNGKSDAKCGSEATLIGPALTESNKTKINGSPIHWEAKEILGPEPQVDKNGEITLSKTTKEISLNIYQLYQYILEVNDNKN